MARSSTPGGRNAVALAGLQSVLAGAAWWAIVAREVRLAGLAVAAAAGAGLAATTLADRARSGRGAFAAEAAERLLDAASLAPLAFVAHRGDPRLALAAIVVLGLGAVAAYTRARARGLGVEAERWPWYATGRTLALAAGLLLGRPEPFLWGMAAADAAVLTLRWRLTAVRA